MSAVIWQLRTEQTQALAAISRRRDLQRLGQALGQAMPALQERLGPRYDEFIALGATRGVGHGLSHLACLGRYLACWAVLGGDFEVRQPWAAALLGDAARTQGAKAFQLCVRTTEQLRSQPQPGQPAVADFTLALQQLDTQLVAAGALGGLLPREAIRLGTPCDLEAVEFSVLQSQPHQHYAMQAGAWRREAVGAERSALTLVAANAAAGTLPSQLSLLSAGDGVARLRLRTRADACCDAQVHPLVTLTGAQGVQQWRGAHAGELTLELRTEPAEALPDEALSPGIATESAASYSLLSLSACGLRENGPALGAVDVQLATLLAHQHLMTWHRPGAGLTVWPQDTPAATAAAPPATLRLRVERDGQPLDGTGWLAGMHALDQQLAAALTRLANVWERESGVTQGRVQAEPRVLCGHAGVTWGWAESGRGMQAAPYFRVAGMLDLIACQLDLRLSGTLALQGSVSQISLHCAASEPLQLAWERRESDADLLQVLAPAQTQFRQPFVLALQASARDELAVLELAGPVMGALVGSCGLRAKADGPGLQWFAALRLEPVSVGLQLQDPVLGTQALLRPLLPACTLLDWSLG